MIGGGQLPVDAIKERFGRALEAGQSVVVTAPTGSGKSTRLPLWMQAMIGGKILVVEPRRVACRSLAGWLSRQRGEQVGGTVGYTVRFDDRTSGKTRVQFATTGVVLRMLAEGEEFGFSGVLVDEFHERSWQVDLILALLRERRAKGEEIALVITSATLEAEALAGELGAKLIEAEGRAYPVDVSYMEEPAAPTRRDLEGRVYGAVESALSEDEGDVLVFLPGKGEIGACETALRPLMGREGVEAVVVHGGLQPREMNHALEESEGRRVYLATNVAETSLTLPGVTCVIDSGLARMKIHRGGRSALALVPVARDAMDQRAGRAGRVRAGRCVRLWSRRFRPSESTQPEIERIELDETMLHAGACGISVRGFEDAPWVTPPPTFAVERARARLEEAGACDGSGRLTEKGRRLAELPVDGHDARILIGTSGVMAGYCCDLVALLQLNRGLEQRASRESVRRGDNVIAQARAELVGGVEHEVHAQVAYLRWGEARRHGLHAGALKEARKTSGSLRELLGLEQVDPRRDDSALPETKELAEHLLGRLPEAGFVVRERAMRRRGGGRRRGRSEPWANGDVELEVYPWEAPRAAGEEGPRAPVAGVILTHYWLGDAGTGVRGVGRMVVPCSYEALADAGLGEVQVGETKLVGGRSPRIFAQIQRILAGVTLTSREEALKGEALWEAVAEFVLEGRLLGEAGRRIRDRLHVWDLLVRWPAKDGAKQGLQLEGRDRAPDARDYLVGRLKRLGLSEAQDLMLVEPEDVVPELEDELGVSGHVVEGFEADFPRTWEHMGRRYRCRVQPTARKVILEPLNKKARRGGDPKVQHLPRFRGFRVYYRHASRVVPLR